MAFSLHSPWQELPSTLSLEIAVSSLAWTTCSLIMWHIAPLPGTRQYPCSLRLLYNVLSCSTRLIDISICIHILFTHRKTNFSSNEKLIIRRRPALATQSRGGGHVFGKLLPTKTTTTTPWRLRAMLLHYSTRPSTLRAGTLSTSSSRSTMVSKIAVVRRLLILVLRRKFGWSRV